MVPHQRWFPNTVAPSVSSWLKVSHQPSQPINTFRLTSQTVTAGPTLRLVAHLPSRRDEKCNFFYLPCPCSLASNNASKQPCLLSLTTWSVRFRRSTVYQKSWNVLLKWFGTGHKEVDLTSVGWTLGMVECPQHSQTKLHQYLNKRECKRLLEFKTDETWRLVNKKSVLYKHNNLIHIEVIEVCAGSGGSFIKVFYKMHDGIVFPEG